jgi:FkbM family methyltransferase
MKVLLRKIYEAVPFKLSVFNLMRKMISLPKKWQAYFYFSGDFTTKIGDKSFKMHNYGYQYHVENELFWGGIENGWEKESVKLWVELSKYHRSVLDIGANTGLFSIITKTVNPEASVIAFEPMPKIYEKLIYNIQLNKLDIKTTTLALSDYSGNATIYPTNLEHVYSVTVNKKRDDISSAVHEVKIRTIRLDEYIIQNNISEIDLIKIDVETHEPEVLTGMGIFLKKFKPTFLIEIQSDAIAARIEELVTGCNYMYYNIDENGGISKVEHLTKSSYFNFLFCSKEISDKIGLK